MLNAKLSFSAALAVDLPFLPGDVLKGLVAAVAAAAVHRAFPDVLAAEGHAPLMPAEPHTAEPGRSRPEVVLAGATVSVPLDAGAGRRTLLGPLDLALREPRITRDRRQRLGQVDAPAAAQRPRAAHARVGARRGPRHGAPRQPTCAAGWPSPSPTRSRSSSCRPAERTSSCRCGASTGRAPSGGEPPRSSSSASGSRRWPTAPSTSSPGASASSWLSPSCWPPSPGCSCSTSPPPCSTCATPWRCAACSPRLPQSVVTATHDLDLALDADRTLVIDGGSVVFDGHAA